MVKRAWRDFRRHKIVTISGRVVRDFDGDGTGSGTVIVDRIVYADLDHNGEFNKPIDRYTRTDGNGHYALNVYAGSYDIRVVLAKGELQTSPSKGRPLRVRRASIRLRRRKISWSRSRPPARSSAGRSTIWTLITSWRLARSHAGLTIFIDRDHDGRYDKGEPRQTTDSTGKYRFSGLFPISYDVGIVATAGRRLEYGPINGGTPSRNGRNFALISTSKIDGHGATVTRARCVSAVPGHRRHERVRGSEQRWQTAGE